MTCTSFCKIHANPIRLELFIPPKDRQRLSITHDFKVSLQKIQKTQIVFCNYTSNVQSTYFPLPLPLARMARGVPTSSSG